MCIRDSDSFAGGAPFWISDPPTPELTSCPSCGRPLSLIAQVWAPLSADHARVLYLLGCNTPCGSSSNGWVALRAMVHFEPEQAPVPAPAPSASAWGDASAMDWGMPASADWGAAEPVAEHSSVDFDMLLNARAERAAAAEDVEEEEAESGGSKWRPIGVLEEPGMRPCLPARYLSFDWEPAAGSVCLLYTSPSPRDS
eukprot:TRINITY_DN16243_c0_g2_i2.p1 TRINITY_DN16243_c0_g2~~TRINITY_DN16243_c0_g2_i2.p1  ORF type:complete len:198 (+),score=31.73 TRINITY_DN16243_c0_g2_i2:114-707(+)